MDLNKIEWGSLDGNQESPHLINDGYYDIENIENQILSGDAFLVFGLKGAGKSMLAKRLSRESLQNDFNIPKPIPLSELPLAELKRVVPGDADAELKYPTAWKLFLLSMLLEQLSVDTSYEERAGRRVRQCVGALRTIGISPNSNPSLANFKTVRREVRVGLKDFIDFATEQKLESSGDTAVYTWLHYMLETCKDFRSARKTILIIDRLDDLNPLKESRGTQLGTLIRAVTDLNEIFRDSLTPIKIVVCILGELFDGLDLRNRGKLATDYGVKLNWYQDTRSHENTHLYKLAQLRATLSIPKLKSITEEILPRRVDNLDALEYLLLHTRHTPRDFLQLLKCCCNGVENLAPLSRNTIIEGVSKYSSGYFRQEIRDSLDIEVGGKLAEAAWRLLGKIQARVTDSSRLTQMAEKDPYLKRHDLLELTEALYSVSAIGNLSIVSGRNYYYYKYRNPDNQINYDNKFVVHRGLWKAINIA